MREYPKRTNYFWTWVHSTKVQLLIRLKHDLPHFPQGAYPFATGLLVLLLATACSAEIEPTPTINPTFPSLATISNTVTSTKPAATTGVNNTSPTSPSTQAAGPATATRTAHPATPANNQQSTSSATPQPVSSPSSTAAPMASPSATQASFPTIQPSATTSVAAAPTSTAAQSPSPTAKTVTTPNVSPSPVPTVEEGTPIAPVEDPGAATDLSAITTCSESYPQVASATLAWSLAAPPGSEQRIALTNYKDGFDRDDVESYGPLAADQTSFIVDNLQGQANHYWRVLTLREGEWLASETAVFVGPTCVTDLQPRDP